MNQRRLHILFHGRFPSEKAAALFAADSARAFGKHFSVSIVTTSRKTHITESVAEYYTLPDVAVTRLWVPDWFTVPILSYLAFAVSMCAYTVGVFFYMLRRYKTGDVVIAIDPLPGLVASLIGKVVYEVHDYPEHWKPLYSLLFARASLIIATNTWKQNALIRDFPHAASRTHMERNGVDLSLYPERDLDACKQAVGLAPHTWTAVYTGHLYGWKGTGTLLEAARQAPQIQFVFVGGTPADVARYRSEAADQSNSMFVGHVPHADIPRWQGAADVLVLPNTATQDIGAQYTSPMKLFEYMASGRPILAARLPAVTEIVNDSTAYFFKPDDTPDLVRMLTEIQAHPEEAAKKGDAAREAVVEFSWESRTQRLMSRAPFTIV